MWTSCRCSTSSSSRAKCITTTLNSHRSSTTRMSPTPSESGLLRTPGSKSNAHQWFSSNHWFRRARSLGWGQVQRLLRVKREGFWASTTKRINMGCIMEAVCREISWINTLDMRGNRATMCFPVKKSVAPLLGVSEATWQNTRANKVVCSKRSASGLSQQQKISWNLPKSCKVWPLLLFKKPSRTKTREHLCLRAWKTQTRKLCMKRRSTWRSN